VTLARQLRVLFAALAVLVFVAVSLAGIWSGRRMLEADLAAETRVVADALAEACRPTRRLPCGAEAANRGTRAAFRPAGEGREGLSSAWGRRARRRPRVVRGALPAYRVESSAPVGTGGRLLVRAETGPAAERLWHAALQALVRVRAPPGGSGARLLAVGRWCATAQAEAEAAWRWRGSRSARRGRRRSAVHPIQAAIRQLSRRARLLLDGAQGLATTLHSRRRAIR